MTNKDREKQLLKQRKKKYNDHTACGYEPYCEFCKDCSIITPCATAYNRMVREKHSYREIMKFAEIKE